MDPTLFTGEMGGTFAFGLITGGGIVLAWAQKTLVAEAKEQIKNLQDRVRELEDERAERDRVRIEKLEAREG